MMPQLLRSFVSIPMRILRPQRDHGTISDADLAPPSNIQPAPPDPAMMMRRLLQAILRNASPDMFLRVTLNDTELWLPRDTLRTIVHCVYVGENDKLVAYVETAHLRWMADKLQQGGTFLDVGAATGATALPIAAHLGDKVRIIAYEPAEAARHLLQATLARNGIDGVTIRAAAVSDAPGEATFREYLQDETGATPFLPEASSLDTQFVAAAPHKMIQVPVVTLDEDALPLIAGSPVVVKIDVEGFEAFVLRGAARLLRSHQAFLSIDIHHDPFGDGQAMTEPAVRDILSGYGYRFENIGHVLLCYPPGA